jgi:hypothetical protein
MERVTRLLIAPWLAALLGGVAHAQRVSSSDTLQARDGHGKPVDWFFVLKLPQETFAADKLPLLQMPGFRSGDMAPFLNKRHCTCPDPTCHGLPHPEHGRGRGSGLCYFYADSNSPTLKYFKDVGLDCLGQGGADPVSQTLLPLYRKNGELLRSAEVEWAFWNDQFASTADSTVQHVCAYPSASAEALPYKPCSGASR